MNRLTHEADAQLKRSKRRLKVAITADFQFHILSWIKNIKKTRPWHATHQFQCAQIEGIKFYYRCWGYFCFLLSYLSYLIFSYLLSFFRFLLKRIFQPKNASYKFFYWQLKIERLVNFVSNFFVIHYIKKRTQQAFFFC